MKKYLACVLLAFALTLNAEAEPKENDKDKKKEVVAVPDNGSTAVLLGLSLIAIAWAGRRHLAAQ